MKELFPSVSFFGEHQIDYYNKSFFEKDKVNHHNAHEENYEIIKL